MEKSSHRTTFFVRFFLCMAAVLLSTAAEAKEPVENLIARLPPVVNTFIAEEPIGYDDKALGASIGYNSVSSGVAITVYLYDLGVASVPDGIDAAIVQDAKEQSMREIKELEKTGVYLDLILIEDKRVGIALGNEETHPVFFVYFSSTLKHPSSGALIPIFSEMYLTGLKGYICKIRISHQALSDEQKKEVNATIGTLLMTLAK